MVRPRTGWYVSVRQLTGTRTKEKKKTVKKKRVKNTSHALLFLGSPLQSIASRRFLLPARGEGTQRPVAARGQLLSLRRETKRLPTLGERPRR
ncbi:hypothetical protein BHE74_00032866, partial [Ensete ventricosum]